MKIKAFSCSFIHDDPLVSYFFPLILGFSRISCQDSWIFFDSLKRFLEFLGLLDRILGFSREVFLYQNPFCEFFQSKKLGIFLEVLGKILQDRTYSWRLTRFLPRVSGNCKIPGKSFKICYTGKNEKFCLRFIPFQMVVC